MGYIVDIDDTDAVIRAIRSLSTVWGGMLLPILDRRLTPEDLAQAADKHGLDSLAGNDLEQATVDFIGSSGYGWGHPDPFGETQFHSRDTLLRSSALDPPPARLTAQCPTPDSLLAFAHLGAKPADRAAPVWDSITHIRLTRSRWNRTQYGVVVDEDNPHDIVRFWNLRARAGVVVPLHPSDTDLNKWLLKDFSLRRAPLTRAGDNAWWEVQGADGLSKDVEHQLTRWAESSRSIDRIDFQPHGENPLERFGGFEPVTTSPFRVETTPASNVIHIPLPALPFLPAHGVVGADVIFDGADDVDPRRTVSLPPFRRHATLLTGSRDSDPAHVLEDGPTFAVRAEAGEVSVPVVDSLEVMRALFDDARVRVRQSDEGKFQTRASDMFGRIDAGHLNHPGTRAVIANTASRSGQTLRQLQDTFRHGRGETASSHEESRAHVERLLDSGLFVPALELQCPSCSVTALYSPESLETMYTCDFCGERVRLALALALSKAPWRYRLAGHLAATKVEALLPALASASVLSTFRILDGPPDCTVFGLEVTLPNSNPVEIDIAVILRDRDSLVVIGEVKNNNRIDENDLSNLRAIQAALIGAGVRCLILLATFKEKFQTEELRAIRAAVNDAGSIEYHGEQIPLFPLLLTQRDLSQQMTSTEHPWRWAHKDWHLDLFGAALESCRRNAGLASWDWDPVIPTRPRFTWNS